MPKNTSKNKSSKTNNIVATGLSGDIEIRKKKRDKQLKKTINNEVNDNWVNYYNNLSNKQKKKEVDELKDKYKLDEKQVKYVKNRIAEITKNHKKNQTKRKNNKTIGQDVSASNYTIDEDNVSSFAQTEYDMTGIEGLPYQFMDTVDLRPGGFAVGRKYAEKIYNRMPLVFMTPCKQLFMDEFNKTDRKNAIGALIAGGEEFAQDLVEGRGKYYSVEYDYNTYYNYLNPMLAAMATYLHISNKEIRVGSSTPRKIISIDWSSDVNDQFVHYFTAKKNVIFYANELNSVSESFDNSSTDSSLANTINQFSDTAKELKFLLGSQSTAGSLLQGAGEAVSSLTETFSGTLANLGGGLVGSLAKGGVKTVINGGKIIFPKFWADSGHNTSYSINFKFRSPDNDSLSIFLNILKPYAKLLCLTLPREDASDPYNGYREPFLVQATAPGIFHIDMGLITSMSVNKGEEGEWNDDGLPTVLDVSIEIEDLYNQVLYMTGYDQATEDNALFNFNIVKDAFHFVSNSAYIDFLANTCGMNIHNSVFDRILQAFTAFEGNKYSILPSRIATHFDANVSNFIGRAFKKFTT